MKLLWILSCGSASEPESPMSVERMTSGPGAGGWADEEQDAAAEASPEPMQAEYKEEEEGRVSRKDAKMDKARGDKVDMEKARPASAPPADDDGEAAVVETRSWFPETFVWAPSVITDESGSASLAVTVPDTLTGWRVLGLAASRDGAQAGDVHSFTSTLPVYVDPRVPEKLRRGDRVEVPVRVVNTTSSEVLSKLSVRATGLDGSAVGTVRVPAGGSIVEIVTLTATRPGAAALEAGLEGADALVKPVRVEPTGRPLRLSKSGVLGTEDAVELSTPSDAEYAELTLTLFPGPLGVLRRELDVASTGSVFDNAYAFALGARGSELLTSLGAPPDAQRMEHLRATRLRAQQKLVANELGADPVQRAAILSAARLEESDPVAERIASRARQQLRQEQLGDGSWATPQGTTLQEFLVRTATICAAVDDEGTTVRCGAVFERNAQHLLNEETADAYTSAMVLRSGAGSSDLHEQLRAQISASLTERGDGLPGVALPEGILRADGRPVTQTDALAAIAIVSDPEQSRPLAAAVIAAYSPARGFGDGVTGALALEALDVLGEAEVPDTLEVRLLIDGEVVERHVLNKAALGETAVLKAPAPLTGSHRYAVEADGVWPGLAWHLDLESYVPWDGDAGPEGLDIEVDHGELAFGRSTLVSVTAAVPRGEGVVIEHSPPVGFVIDETSVVGGVVESVDDSGVRVRVDAGHGGFVTVEYSGVPTLRGQLTTGPATVALLSDRDLVKAAPPEVWSLN